MKEEMTEMEILERVAQAARSEQKPHYVAFAAFLALLSAGEDETERISRVAKIATSTKEVHFENLLDMLEEVMIRMRLRGLNWDHLEQTNEFCNSFEMRVREINWLSRILNWDPDETC